jgi:hypothetical protein
MFKTKLFQSLSLILTAIAGLLAIAPATSAQTSEANPGANLKVQFTAQTLEADQSSTLQQSDRTTTELDARRRRRGRGRGNGNPMPFPCPACGMG